MMKRQSNQRRAIWLKAIMPGSVMSCLLLVAWFLGWSFPSSLHGFVLLTAAWLGGAAWVFMPAYAHPVDSRSAHQAADYDRELRTLVATIERQCAKEISSARDEVQRTGTIMQEAVEGLNLSFHKLGAHAQRSQGETIEAMQENAAVSAWRPEQVDEDVGRAVRCLQVEDIATQSLSTADDRLLHLRRLITLMQPALGLASRPDPEQLQRLKAELEELVAAGDNAGRHVLQDSMSSGDIELF